MGPASDPVPAPDWRGRVAGLLRWWRWSWSIEPVFTAPLTPAQPEAPTRFVPTLTDLARHPSPAWRPPSSPCVLVVDDNPVNLELASAVLWGLGAGPILAADGAEAVALALELRPDLILMDLQMPVLDGVEATRQIRRFEQQHGGARMPVVAFTSSTMVDAQRLMRCGFDAVLQKPCAEPAMRECLERWCPPQGRAIDPGAAARA